MREIGPENNLYYFNIPKEFRESEGKYFQFELHVVFS
jgi:hypothetical protein